MRMTITGIDGEQCSICVYFIASKVCIFSDEMYVLQNIMDEIYNKVTSELYVNISDLLYLCGAEQNDFASNVYFRDCGWSIDDTYNWKLQPKPENDSGRKNIAIFYGLRKLFPDGV